VTDTIRLFFGASPNGDDYESEAVAEYSARKHASLPIEITWMRQATSGPYSGWACGSGRTPFSHYRWSLPAMCNYEGRAIYADSDFVFMSDLAELWRQPIPGVLLCQKSKKPGGKLKTCCMVFDCAKARGHVPTFDKLRQMPDPQGTLGKYFQQHDELTSGYGCGNWNTRDPQTAEDLYRSDTKAVHHTRIEHQLHLAHAIARLKAQGKSHWYGGPVFRHPNTALQSLFDQLLSEAIAAGHTYESYHYGDVAMQRANFAYKHHKGQQGALA